MLLSMISMTPQYHYYLHSNRFTQHFPGSNDSKFMDFTKDKITQKSSPEKTTDRTTFQNKATKSVDVDQNPTNYKTPSGQDQCEQFDNNLDFIN